MIQKKIIAHRGIPGLAHENTCESFEKAVIAGADMIEFDIRRTKDDVLVAFHDPTIKSNNKSTSLNQLTFTDLQLIAAQNQFKIPTVQEIFSTFSGRIGFDIEFKEENCEEEAMELATKYQCVNQCIITSFNLSIIKKVQSKWPEIPAGLLINDQKQILNNEVNLLKMLCPSKELFLSNRSFFTKWNQTGSFIAVWTVDSTTILRQLLKDPLISAIITNRCDRALQLRKKSSNDQIV